MCVPPPRCAYCREDLAAVQCPNYWGKAHDDDRQGFIGTSQLQPGLEVPSGGQGSAGSHKTANAYCKGDQGRKYGRARSLQWILMDSYRSRRLPCNEGRPARDATHLAWIQGAAIGVYDAAVLGRKS